MRLARGLRGRRGLWDRAGNGQGFVAVERNGVWGRAIEVPGLGALNKGGAAPTSARCRAPRRATARPAGDYRRPRAAGRGSWPASRTASGAQAIEVPGLRALNTGVDGRRRLGVVRLGGQLRGRRELRGPRPERAGVRGQREERRLGQGDRACPAWEPERAAGPNAEVDSVSCASAGNCAAGGTYADPLRYQGFVAGEKNGVWGTAIEVPGLGALNRAGTPGSSRCRAPRRATARPAAPTPTTTATPRGSS